MSRQNHYQILGVPSDADAAQIRAAYVLLLKRHHPDQSNGREIEDNGPQIQRIIAAYRTLKDPREPRPIQCRVARALLLHQPETPSSPFARKMRRATSRLKLDREAITYAVMLVVAAVGLHLLVSRIIQEPRPSGKNAGQHGRRCKRWRHACNWKRAVRNAGMMSQGGGQQLQLALLCRSPARPRLRRHRDMYRL